MEYDKDNIFAKILRSELPCHTVYEDNRTVAFMDVMPQAEGHVLVVPRAPSRNIFDADPAVLSALAPVVQKVARAVKAAYKADGVGIFQYNERASGQTIFHLHVHIVPRHDGIPLRQHTMDMENDRVLKAGAQKVREALAAF